MGEKTQEKRGGMNLILFRKGKFRLSFESLIAMIAAISLFFR